MIKRYHLLIILFSTVVFSQDFTSVIKGEITITTGQKYSFINLKKTDNEIEFINSATNSKVTYLLNTIQTIENENHEIVYEKKKKLKTEEELANEQKFLDSKKDTLFKANYPDGIYKTKYDFIQKKPSDISVIDPKGLIGLEKPYLNSIEDNCFFYYADSDKKVKKVFAISYKGYLYFQINAISSNENEEDDGLSNDFFPNSFVRVIIGGKNYLYTEANLGDTFGLAAAYGGLGGTAGSAIANTLIHKKGIVWDFKKQEFNIFKNCNDYDYFIVDLYPEGVQDCEDQKLNIFKIRSAMEKIK